MNRRASLFAILALGVFAPFATSQQQFRIAGVVVDSASGSPIDRAEVSIVPVNNLGDASTTLSASDGHFVFAGLAPGKYRLTASRIGYTDQGLDQHESYMTAVAVGPKLDSEHIRFRLFRESVVAGNVSDESGEPVREAELFLFRRSFSGGDRKTQIAGRTTTDDLGDYRFPHLAPGTYFVVAYARPWYGIGSQIIDRARASDVTVLTRVPRRLEVDDNDGPIPSETADALPQVQQEPPVPANPLRDVVYPLAFYSNADSLDSSTPLVLSPGSTLIADFSLHSIPALHLLVKDPAPPHDESSGFPYSRIDASLQLAGFELATLPSIRAPQMPGYFEVSNVSPGEIQFRSAAIGAEGLNIQSTRQLITSENRIDLSSSASISVTGTVKPSPRPSIVAGGEAHVGQIFLKLASADGHTTYASQINAKGEFLLAVPAGKYNVALDPQDAVYIESLQATGAQVSAHSITISPGSSVKLSVHLVEAGATVSGVALKNGHPCAGVMLVLVPEDPTQSATLFHRDQSDSDGTFTMSPIFPGRYTLLAIENGWDLEWSKLSVLFPYLAAGLPLEVKPGATISTTAKVQ